MAHTEGVVLALASCGKRGKAAVLLDGVQLRAPPGQYLVRICLMTDIPDDAVVGRIENVVQDNRELHGAKPRCEVSAPGADGADEKVPQLLGDPHELGSIDLA